MDLTCGGAMMWQHAPSDLHTADAHGLYEKFGFERRSDFLTERPIAD
jgi:hypothetical protein